MRRRSPLLLFAAALLAACAQDGGSTASDDKPRKVLEVRDAADGKLRWSLDLDPAAETSYPELTRDEIIVQRREDTIAWSVADGREVRRVESRLRGHVQIAGLAIFEYGDRLEARSLADGRLMWRRAEPLDVIPPSDGQTLAVVMGDGPRYKPGCGTTDDVKCTINPNPPKVPVKVSRLDPRTGKSQWVATLPAGTTSAQGSAGGQRILLKRNGKELIALNSRNGAVAWNYRSDALGTMVVRDPWVAIEGVDQIRRFDVLRIDTGVKAWTAPTSDDPLLSAFGQAPFVGGQRGVAFRRDPATGRQLPGTVPYTAYSVDSHGDLLVGADGKTLTASRAGKQIWSVPLARDSKTFTIVVAHDRYVVTLTEPAPEPPKRK